MLSETCFVGPQEERSKHYRYDGALVCQREESSPNLQSPSYSHAEGVLGLNHQQHNAFIALAFNCAIFLLFVTQSTSDFNVTMLFIMCGEM